MMTSDDSLALAAAKGDREAFSVLLRRHYDGLFRLCFRLTGDQHSAEDVTQDICLALSQKLKGFRGDSKFSTWLYRVAVNTVHDWRRRGATRTKAAAGWGDWEVARRSADAEQAEGLDWLRQAMATLPEDLRDTLALTLDAELTQRETAEVLGLSEGTVAWRLSEIRKRLKKLKEREEQ